MRRDLFSCLPQRYLVEENARVLFTSWAPHSSCFGVLLPVQAANEHADSMRREAEKVIESLPQQLPGLVSGECPEVRRVGRFVFSIVFRHHLSLNTRLDYVHRGMS